MIKIKKYFEKRSKQTKYLDLTKDSATISFVKEFIDIIFEAVNTSIRKEGDENLESNKNNI